MMFFGTTGRVLTSPGKGVDQGRQEGTNMQERCVGLVLDSEKRTRL